MFCVFIVKFVSKVCAEGFSVKAFKTNQQTKINRQLQKNLKKSYFQAEDNNNDFKIHNNPVTNFF